MTVPGVTSSARTAWSKYMFGVHSAELGRLNHATEERGRFGPALERGILAADHDAAEGSVALVVQRDARIVEEAREPRPQVS
jgi:hypothetical protein